MRVINEGNVQANGLQFSYLEAGEGPLVLLLHGFPDNALTWDRVMPALVDAGYRAVAPFMRGYPPTTIPADGRYDPAALADDVAGLVDVLNDGEPALVVGHDWGALTTYAAVTLHPEKISRAVAIAIGHPGGTPRIFEHPHLLQHAFHFWLFQLPVFAEVAVRTNDFALIDYLWHLWSPGHEDPDHIKGVKETLAQPNAVEAAIGYYRAFPQFPLKYPDLAQRIQFEPLTRPTLTVFGGNDPARVLAEGDEAFFAGEHRTEVIEGAGHFVQREQPEALTKLVLEWLKG
jgi:pimeloyl-ACP methyl ester carboxylesterase